MSRGGLVAGAALLVLTAGPALGQGGDFNPLVETRPRMPGFLPTAPTLSPAAPTPGLGLAREGGVVLSEVVVAGSTCFAAAELRAVVEPFLGRPLQVEDLLALRNGVTRLYLAHGYLNSGAVLPDQDIGSGLLTLVVVEGRLDQVKVEGAGWVRPEVLAAWLAGEEGEVFKAEAIQDRLQVLMLKMPLTRIDVRLVPGATAGHSSLDVTVEEAFPLTGAVTVANDLPPSVGGIRSIVDVGLKSLSGLGDPLSLQYSIASGYEAMAARYEVRIPGSSLGFHLRASRETSNIVAGVLTSLDVSSDSWSGEIGGSYLLIETAERELSVGLDLRRHHQQTFLDGTPFAFTAGADAQGRTTTSVLAFPVDWVERRSNRAIALRSTVLVGTPWLGATAHPDKTTPDGQFLQWQGQAQAAFKVAEDGQQIIGRLDVQLSSDKLLSSEKAAIGGVSTVRGYEASQFLYDNAVIGSLEYRYPLGETHVPVEVQWVLAPFLDAARGHDKDTPAASDFFSVGLGLLTDLSPYAESRLYVARTLSQPESAGSQTDTLGYEVHWSVKAGF